MPYSGHNMVFIKLYPFTLMFKKAILNWFKPYNIL